MSAVGGTGAGFDVGDPADTAPAGVLPRTRFDALLDALAARGYEVIGPVARGGAIVYGTITRSDELPIGVAEEQDAGRYRLVDRDDAALFGFSLGPASPKDDRLPPELTLWRGRLREDGAVADVHTPARPRGRIALLGVRSCDLHAMGILERALAGQGGDEGASGSDRFIIAVQCTHAGGTCFCHSMGTGPVARSGFDLALTELIDEEGHRFLVQAGSQRGAEVLAELPVTVAGEATLRRAAALSEATSAQMGRTLDTTEIKDLLYRNLEHPRWEEVGERCLSCGNCTMVCPTCFCTSVEDTTDLAGTEVERVQRWDSCFSVEYSHVHGGAVRASSRARYRQWMTHKLATWHDQFGSSGCVGCGRCITWCPVGIDLTEEAAAIRAGEENEESR